MNSGKLDQRVILKSRATTRDAMGGAVVTYNAIATVWAEAYMLRGREFFAARQEQAEVTVRFRLRYRADLAVDWRVQWDGVDYDILSPPILIGRKEGLELMCATVQNAQQ